MGNTIIGCISGILAIGMLCMTGFRCADRKATAISQCIERTEKPAECRQAFEKLAE